MVFYEVKQFLIFFGMVNMVCMYGMVGMYCKGVKYGMYDMVGMVGIDNMVCMCYTYDTYDERRKTFSWKIKKGCDVMSQELTIITPSKIENNRLDFKSELQNFFKLEDYRGDTPRTYESAINHFLQWVKDEKITCISKEVIINYKAYLGANGSLRTANTYLSGLRCLFRYLSEKGIPNLMLNVKNFKIKKGYAKLPIPLEKYIVIDDTLFEERHDEQSFRDYAIFKLSVICMLREIEVSRSDKEDILNIDGKHILKIQGKGCDMKDDISVLEEEVYQAIQDYLKIRGKDNYKPLFVSLAHNHKGNRLTTRSIRRILKGILVRFGLDSSLYTGHSTRHTGATLLNKSGKASLQEIQETLRHKDINTTTIYTHLENRLTNPMEEVLQRYINEEKGKYYGKKQNNFNS